MSPAIVRAIWETLSPVERQAIAEWLIDTARGKPPKPVRIAALRKREIVALAKVADKL